MGLATIKIKDIYLSKISTIFLLSELTKRWKKNKEKKEDDLKYSQFIFMTWSLTFTLLFISKKRKEIRWKTYVETAIADVPLY